MAEGNFRDSQQGVHFVLAAASAGILARRRSLGHSGIAHSALEGRPATAHLSRSLRGHHARDLGDRHAALDGSNNERRSREGAARAEDRSAEDFGSAGLRREGDVQLHHHPLRENDVESPNAGFALAAGADEVGDFDSADSTVRHVRRRRADHEARSSARQGEQSGQAEPEGKRSSKSAGTAKAKLDL